MPRRSLNLATLDESIAEIERLQREGYVATGKWTLSQICEHLTATMRMGLDGGQRMPWLLRKTMGAWMIRSWLKKRSMRAGLPTLDRLRPKINGDGEATKAADDPGAIAACLATLREVRDFSGELPPHSMCDGVDLPRYQDLCVIHAQHHLGYLAPRESEATPR
ncbi:MAG TPA: DUF1569 domain-containing protein [Pirellulaceae bacterium]|jgi:hypothetical protein|nr:DUF1569 domain-containing protein [Pirellulaceae bacterium]